MKPKRSEKPALTPHQFLRDLGLQKRPGLEQGSEEWIAAVRQAGADATVLDEEDGFTAAGSNVLFADERIARVTLSRDFDRYREHLKALREFWNFPAAPRRISEIGGGAGIISLYLAQQYPGALVSVYDWADAPLMIGRKWAEERGVRNIQYQKASYEQLASGAGPVVEPNDVVLLYYGLPLNADPPAGTEMFSYWEVFEKTGVSPPPDMHFAAAAVSRLLNRDGLGIICGNWTPWGAVHFFDALRKTDLGIDWSRSFVEGEIRKDSFRSGRQLGRCRTGGRRGIERGSALAGRLAASARAAARPVPRQPGADRREQPVGQHRDPPRRPPAEGSGQPCPADRFVDVGEHVHPPHDRPVWPHGVHRPDDLRLGQAVPARVERRAGDVFERDEPAAVSPPQHRHLPRAQRAVAVKEHLDPPRWPSLRHDRILGGGERSAARRRHGVGLP